MNTIGRYQLVEKLGQGGMGIVYRAFDPLLQRVVAVKLIASLEANDELKERFFREARAAGQLSHKNIITIYDLGEHDGQPFLAMEFLEGQDLQQRIISHGTMTFARKLELAVEICEGIEYAHVHGVIHRDIKPANIFITTSGTAKLLDFGLARLITSELTNSKMMMGTVNYMAPEQVRGERADHRSDIFSTGVVLYELFGGRKAFEGDSFGATLYKILQEVPEPLRNIDANLPPEIIAIVERALEKTRETRYQHMSEMLGELTAYRQQLMLLNSPSFGRPPSNVTRTPSDTPTMASVPITPLPALTPGSGSSPGASTVGEPTPAPSSSLRPVMMAAAIVLVGLLGALVAWTINRGDPPPPQAAPAAADATVVQTQQAIESRLEQASKALQAGDDAAAQRHADAVLAISPGHAEARRLRDLARQAGEAVTRGLSAARNHYGAGRYDEASRAAGEVLAVDPGNAEAKRLMDDSAARSQGKGVQEARTRTARARNAAAAAGAATLAAAPYGAALAAERDAASLFKRGQLAEAMSKFWEASGLFRSAEVAAETEAAMRAERARLVQAERKPSAPATADASAPKPAPTPPSAPPIPTTTGLPQPPGAAPVQIPTPPPAAAPQQAPGEVSPPAVSPTAGINETVGRYRAALESRSMDALKRVWPGLAGTQESAIRRDFQNSTRIDVEIVNPQITVNGPRATVVFTRRYEVQTVDRQQLRSESRTTMSLQRVGTNWAIDQITYEPVR